MPTLRLLPELEEALRRIPGVQAASVVTAADRSPTEVHVLARPGKAPKQVVRDVQSLAQAQYDIEIDHRIVSVVLLDEAEAPPPTVEALPRAVLASMTVRTTADELEVHVGVTVGGRLHEGSATGSAAGGRRARTVAAAALDAVADIVAVPCAIESSAIVSSGSRDVALTVVRLLTPRAGEQAVAGTAVVRADPDDAVCRSVLDAVNRQLTA